METFEVLSTRLFPKNGGAAAYRITGIAERCDWVVLSDHQPPHAVLVNRSGAASPRHVFLSLRSPFEAIAYFIDKVLPLITSPFVLVSGSEDVTVPHQIDQRLRRFSPEEFARIQALLDDPRLVHWVAENLDDGAHPKMSPLPLGMVFPEPVPGNRIGIPAVPPLATRPLRVLCAHRVRGGPQWDLRRKVTELCRRHFAGLCTILEEEVSEEAFFDLVRAHAFVICVAGGGLDPAPKAWHAMLYGAIPIILSTPLDPAYAQLPVAMVDNWDEQALTLPRLQKWRSMYAPQHDGEAQRAALIQRLGADYWWASICARLPDSA